MLHIVFLSLIPFSAGCDPWALCCSKARGQWRRLGGPVLIKRRTRSSLSEPALLRSAARFPNSILQGGSKTAEAVPTTHLFDFMISGPHLLWDPFSCLWMLFWSLCFSRLPLCLCLCLSLAAGLCYYHSWKPSWSESNCSSCLAYLSSPFDIWWQVGDKLNDVCVYLLAEVLFLLLFLFPQLVTLIIGQHCGALDSEEMTLRALLPQHGHNAALCSLYLFSLHCILHLMCATRHIST